MYRAVMAIVVFCLFVPGILKAQELTDQTPRPELPLRYEMPLDQLVSEARSVVPGYLEDRRIPGVSVALLKDGSVAWAEGFGVKSVMSQEPVTATTVFKVASNSKLLTAYTAMRMVDRGVLSLDEPLNSYLDEPWLPDSQYRDVITLRHVISHTAGLGHSTPSRDNVFEPGAGYSYSAIGFQYLQAVMEHTSGMPLDVIARSLVFNPIRMTSSSFILPEELAVRAASGHINGIMGFVLFGVVFLVLAVVGIVLLVLTRASRRIKWRATMVPTVVFLVSVVAASDFLLYYLLDMLTLPDYAWPVVAVGNVALALLCLVTGAGHRLLFRGLWQPGLRTAATVMWGMVCVALLLYISGRVLIPVPVSGNVVSQAAASASATAGDMALFMAELAKPSHLSQDKAVLMRTPQVKLHSSMSWGLGPGIMHTNDGDALWQWGQHVDFQSLALIYPDLGFGVVVITNSDLLQPDAASDIARLIIGGDMNPIARASGLGYNYTPEE